MILKGPCQGAELQTFSVAPSQRGNGVGTLPLDEADRELRPVLVHYARFSADAEEL